jgi:hypothetical protein
VVAEADISRTVCSHYRSEGLCVQTEVPLLSKWIDVVAYDSDFETLILVETKVHDWMSAIRQASVYTLCTPDAYIAISKTYSHRVDTDLIRKIGLGFLEVDGSVTCVLEPSGKMAIQPSVREWVVKSLESTGGEES